MAETLTIRTASSTEVVKIAVPGPQGPKGDKGDPGDVAGLPLSTLGDTLYRGASENQRLAIGTTGQVLKVSAGGIPEWANESGAVSSVAGKTGVVTLDKNDVGLGNVANTAQVTSVTGTAPIVSSGGTTPAISISAATTSAAGSMSAADKTKLDGIASGATANTASSATPSALGTAAAGTSSDFARADHVHAMPSAADVGAAPSTNIEQSAINSSLGNGTLGEDIAYLDGIASGLGTAATSDSTDFAAASHAAAHASSGSDPLFDQELNTTDIPTFAGLSLDGSAQLNVGGLSVGTNNLFIDVGAAEIEAGLPISFTGANAATNAATTLTNLGGASDNHVHGNLTNDGKLGSTAGLPVVTTTAGAVTTLALGTANQVLRVNSGATGVEFADPAASGVTGAASSASDVLGVSGSDITGVDANADRIIFFDDSAGKLTHLTVGSGLSISDTTISATASGGSKTYAVFSAEHNQPPSTAFATLDTRNSIAVLDFDDATDESAVFVSIIPEGASLGSGLKIRLHWMATTATSGNVVWDVSLERMNTDLDSDSFDTIASGTAAANGTSGILTVTEITLTTIDSVTAGDGFRLKVTRDANNASDTMTGDAELVVVEVRSAA